MKQKITMNNPRVIIGKERSGKSFLARNISFGFSNPIILDGEIIAKNERFMFSEVKADTDLIIIDNVPSLYLKKVAFNCVGNIYIERKGSVGFYALPPQIIIISDIDEQCIDRQIIRRFEIIRTHIEEADGRHPIFHAERLEINVDKLKK